MNAIRRTAQLNQRELDDCTNSNASWHRDYDDTAFIYIGGLHLELSEGDIITIFSQYGEPVWIKLARDKETGKSRGFAWLKYEDQRSCELAVDNLTGATVMGRLLNVDHTRYKKRDDEDMGDNTVPPEEHGRNGHAGEDHTESESEEEQRPLIKEEKELLELMRNHDDDDPMKAYLIEQKQEEVDKALKALKPKESRKKDKHRRRRRERSRSGERRREHESGRRRRDKSEERRRSRDCDHIHSGGEVSRSRRRDDSRGNSAAEHRDRRQRHRSRDRSGSPHRRREPRKDDRRRERSRS